MVRYGRSARMGRAWTNRTFHPNVPKVYDLREWAQSDYLTQMGRTVTLGTSGSIDN